VRCDGGVVLQSDGVKAAIGAAEQRLGTRGRLLVRKSGTEPLLRIMVEGEDETLLADVVAEIAAAVAEVSVPEGNAAE
jgi:phosphoglucosamine mutase